MSTRERTVAGRRSAWSSAMTPPSLMPARCTGPRARCSIRALRSSPSWANVMPPCRVGGAPVTAMVDEHEVEVFGERGRQSRPAVQRHRRRSPSLRGAAREPARRPGPARRRTSASARRRRIPSRQSGSHRAVVRPEVSWTSGSGRSGSRPSARSRSCRRAPRRAWRAAGGRGRRPCGPRRSTRSPTPG